MATTPAERSARKHSAKHGRRSPVDPREGARRRVAATSQVGSYSGAGYGIGPYNNTNPPVSGPAPGPMDLPQSGHLNPDQFVGFPGGFSTDAGNYTGVQAIEGATGNGGAGGSGDSGAGGDSGGAAS